MVWWQVILFPLAILFDGITRFRNHLFNIGSTPTFEFDANVINVGNLAVGGTGKTPMVNYLTDHFLSQGKHVAILSRGYRRSTRGLRIATEDDSSQTLGDEPFMYWKRYSDQGVMVVVAEERAFAIPWILAEQPDNDVILLDDAFQHRFVTPTINILLSTYHRPFFSDFVLPAGRLRERRSGARRANLVVMTKCPSKTTHAEMRSFDQQITKYTEAPTAYTTIRYRQLVSFDGKERPMPKSFVAVAGLASNAQFEEWLRGQFEVHHFLSYGDHKTYTKGDVRRIVGLLGPEIGLITTEKDAVKLQTFDALQDFACFYVPIEVHFLRGEDILFNLIERTFVDYDREVPEEGKDN